MNKSKSKSKILTVIATTKSVTVAGYGGNY